MKSRTSVQQQRWLRVTSDRAFLCRFRHLHPRHLLSFYIRTTGPPPLVRFRRGCARLPRRLLHHLCRRGRYAVCSPLHPARGVATVPWPCIIPGTVRRPLLAVDDGDQTAVALVLRGRRVWVHLSDLQAQDDCRASALVLLPQYWGICPKFGLLAYGNLYMISKAGHIIGLDLPTKRLFDINLPGVVEDMSDGALLQVAAVGDNADFLFLRIENEVFYMHIGSRAVEKIYVLQEPNCDIHPFMMVWPPTFPALDDGLTG
uniref:F-box protein AT5G49610-like beta-propeller domain-containing protein n=1 Tax=Setaria italica TaxID=4555 RepID=K3YZG5_SETIT